MGARYRLRSDHGTGDTVGLDLPGVRNEEVVYDSAPEEPVRDLSTWAVDRLEDVLAAARDGQELESIRVIAQSRAQGSGEPDGARLRWARLFLDANDRLPGGTPWNDARKNCQSFALRTWIIRSGPTKDLLGAWIGAREHLP